MIGEIQVEHVALNDADSDDWITVQIETNLTFST